MKGALSQSLKHLVSRKATPQAKRLVLSLIEEKKALTVQELYKLTSQHQAPNGASEEGSSTEEPVIPSMRYLKKVVLPELEGAHEVRKVHSRVEISAEEVARMQANMSKKNRARGVAVPTYERFWRWQLAEKKVLFAPPAEVKPFGAEVGVGEDWSHLNKRRQRARAEKVERDVQWLRELNAARSEARAEAS